jgi:hypothetical protein
VISPSNHEKGYDHIDWNSMVYLQLYMDPSLECGLCIPYHSETQSRWDETQGMPVLESQAGRTACKELELTTIKPTVKFMQTSQPAAGMNWGIKDKEIHARDRPGLSSIRIKDHLPKLEPDELLNTHPVVTNDDTVQLLLRMDPRVPIT